MLETLCGVEGPRDTPRRVRGGRCERGRVGGAWRCNKSGLLAWCDAMDALALMQPICLRLLVGTIFLQFTAAGSNVRSAEHRLLSTVKVIIFGREERCCKDECIARRAAHGKSGFDSSATSMTADVTLPKKCIPRNHRHSHCTL